MAQLLLMADPGVLAARPSWALGMVIDVFEDDADFSALVRRSQPVVIVQGMSVPDARAAYCAPGCPPDVALAVGNTRAALWALEAMPEKERDAKAIDAARAEHEAALAASRGFPERAVRIDLAALSPHAVATAEAHRQVLDSVAAAAKSAAKAAVLDELAAKRGRALTTDERAASTKAILDDLAVEAEAAMAAQDVSLAKSIDVRRDQLIAASASARAAIEAPALEAVPVPEPIVVDAKSLAAFIVSVKA